MRGIWFRGKDAQGRWLYGAVGDCLGMMEASPFLPGTFGELTGLCDAGGEDIYEGDIVRGRSEYFGHGNFCRGVVLWSEGRFVISFGDSVEACEKLDDTEELREWHEDVEVIGNIFDEPELLENGGKLKA